MKTLENMLSKISNKYGIIKNIIAKKPRAYRVSELSLVFLIMIPVFFLFCYMFLSFTITDSEGIALIALGAIIILVIVDYFARITSFVSGLFLFIVKSFKLYIIVNFIAKKPIAYKISILSFIFLVMSPVFFLFFYMFVSFFESSNAAALFIILVVIVFVNVDLFACMTSIVSGLFIVKSFKHSLLWLIPVGILLLVSIIFSWIGEVDIFYLWARYITLLWDGLINSVSVI